MGGAHDNNGCQACAKDADFHKFRSIGPPIEYISIILADRFQGTSPEAYMDMPADRRALLLSMIGIEGQIDTTWREAKEGTEPGDEIWIAEWELDLWEDE